MAPDRTTPVGAVLDAYLTRATSLEPCAAHLLFAANRWERSGDLCAALQRGTHVVVDRYAFSGAAYAAAQLGAAPELLDMCKHAVFYMDVPLDVARTRAAFGAERFEDAEFLARVQLNYARLRDETWEHSSTLPRTRSRCTVTSSANSRRCWTHHPPSRRCSAFGRSARLEPQNRPATGSDYDSRQRLSKLELLATLPTPHLHRMESQLHVRLPSGHIVPLDADVRAETAKALKRRIQVRLRGCATATSHGLRPPKLSCRRWRPNVSPSKVCASSARDNGSMTTRSLETQ